MRYSIREAQYYLLRLTLLVVATLVSVSLVGHTHTLQGKIYNAENNEALANASIHLLGKTKRHSTSTTSDDLGIFSLPYQAGDTLNIGLVGYIPQTHTLTTSSASMDLRMKYDTTKSELESIQVNGSEIYRKREQTHDYTSRPDLIYPKNGHITPSLFYSLKHKTWGARLEYHLSFERYKKELGRVTRSSRRFVDKLYLHLGAYKPDISNNNLIITPHLIWDTPLININTTTQVRLSLQAGYYWNINSKHKSIYRDHTPSFSIATNFKKYHNLSNLVRMSVDAQLWGSYRNIGDRDGRYISQNWVLQASTTTSVYYKEYSISPLVGYYYDVENYDRGLALGANMHVWSHQINSPSIAGKKIKWMRARLDFSAGYKWIQHRDRQIYMSVQITPTFNIQQWMY